MIDIVAYIMLKFFRGLTRNTFLLAFASLFADISTEMLYPVLPIFLTVYLGATGSAVGLVEGISTAAQNIQMGIAGYLSDRIKNRKLMAVFGYALAAFSKPMIGFARVWQFAAAARFLDRFGTGTRSAPRDAMIASSSGRKSRGKAFGLEGLGDNLGAFLGPLLTVLLIYGLNTQIRWVFYLSLIPGLLAVLFLIQVKEERNVEVKARAGINLSLVPSVYWRYLLAIFVFGVGNISSSFMILQTRNVGVPLIGTIMVYSLFNLIASFVSYPAGALSDVFGRRKMILLSYFVFALSLAGFYLFKNLLVIAFLFTLYGVYQGIFRSVGKAYASDFVGENVRATAIGFFNGVIGLSGFLGNVFAGLIYDKFGYQFVFMEALFFVALGGLIFLFDFR